MFRVARSALKVVLFDAVGTLFFPEPPVAEAYETLGRRFDSRLSCDEIGARFRAAFERQEAVDRLDPEGRTDDERERRRWREIVAEVFADLPDTVELFGSLWRHFARPEAWRLYDDARPAVEALIERGIMVGVASNFDERLAAIVAAHLPRIRAEHVFTSSALGRRKPAREFFRRCEAGLSPKVPGEEILLVGDDPLLDVAGAEAAGWKALLIDRRSSHGGDGLTRIASLAELPSTIRS